MNLFVTSFIVLLILKLLEVITISWFWVFLPLLIPTIFIFIVLLIGAIIVMIGTK